MSTCSKIILLGEHSVVYGKKALALPITNLRIEVTLLDKYIYEDNHIKYIKRIIEQNFNVPKKYIRISSSIPSSAGMGSSAAIAIEIARKYGVDEEFVVNLAEQKKHGKPSGIDSNVISKEKALIYQKGKKNRYVGKLGAFLVISNTQQKGSTKKAVEMVAKMNRMDLIDDLGNISQMGIDAYLKKDLYTLANCMIKSQNILKKLRLSTHRIDRIVKLSKGYCLASKLSGGGFGGVVISLTKSFKQANILKKRLNENNVKKVYIVKI